MRRTALIALVSALVAAAPAAAAPTTALYAGTTAQHQSVALRMRTQGVATNLTAFRIAWASSCPGSGFVYHGRTRLSGIDVVGRRVSARTRDEAPAGAGRVAHLRLYLKASFTRSGHRVTGRWRAKVRIADRHDRTLTRCHSGVVTWRATKEPRTA